MGEENNFFNLYKYWKDLGGFSYDPNDKIFDGDKIFDASDFCDDELIKINVIKVEEVEEENFDVFFL